jgi:endoglucanase
VLAPRPDVLAARPGARFFGAYDPAGLLLDDAFGVELFYTDLSAQSLAALDARLAAVGQRDRTPLVTLEPWPLAGSSLREETLLADLAAGRYDTPLAQVAASLRRYDGRIFLRFAHEMELASDVYPWGGGEPAQYVAAYRHVHALLSSEAGDWLRWVWSPAGNANAAAYYPGDDMVDYVGITLLGSAEFDAWSGSTERRSFRQLLDEKYSRAGAFGKPVLIAELGVSGAPELQDAWLRDMFPVLDAYPGVRGIVYFNAPNAVNRLVPDPPDYRITSRQWQVAQGATPGKSPGRSTEPITP